MEVDRSGQTPVGRSGAHVVPGVRTSYTFFHYAVAPVQKVLPEMNVFGPGAQKYWGLRED